MRPSGWTLRTALTELALVLAACRQSGPAAPDAAVMAGCSLAATALERETGRVATVSADTALLHPIQDLERRGCLVQLADSAGLAPLVPLSQAYEAAGWASQTGYMADGPDGSAQGFLHAGVLCGLRGEWDGGDDSDSTSVPDPGYKMQVSCWRALPEDLPPS